LQWLNEIAGRDYIDITQYPVLPWSFIANENISGVMENKKFRDLSKNMGSLGDEDRIKYFIQKYESNTEE
jgi:hypothetical protein